MTDVSGMPPGAAEATVFRASGEMAKLMRDLDWAATPVGPVYTWSASLRTLVSTLLASRHAMFLWWGPELIQFYNDAYRQSLGPDRHPSALGRPGRECWTEIWPTIGGEIESIMAGGDSTWHEDYLVPITRGDRVHDVYWSYSYSPVQDDDGSVAGVLVTVQETTGRVVSDRRVRSLQELTTGVQRARSAADVCGAAMSALRGAPLDVAFALLYRLDSDLRLLRLAGSLGLEAGSSSSPRELSIESDSPWPVARALSTGRLETVGEPSTPKERIALERWPEPVAEVLTLPLAAEDPKEGAHGVLVLGLNPRLPCNPSYAGFAEQAAREISGALDRLCRLDREQQAALAAARGERKLLEDVFDLSPAFLAVVRGPEHVFEFANAAYDRLIGHRPGIGQKVLDVVPEVAGQGFVELLDRVYRTGEPFVGNELAIQLQVNPGGPLEERHVNFVYQPMRDASGVVTGILVSGVDVTALVHARQAAERARLDAERLAAEGDAERRQLLTVLDQSPLAIVIAEAPSGRFRFLNAKVAELFGESPVTGSVGDESADFRGLHPDGRKFEPHEWPLSRALQGETVWNEIIAIERRKTGQRFEISINAAPVRDAEGRIIAGVAMFWDVTEERRAEQQLRDVQRIQAVGTLAGGVAHEINNQMTTVMGFGAFVLRALGSEHPQSSDVRRVLQAGERAARVSQQLLAFTRQQVTQPRMLDLQEVVTDLTPVLQQLLGSDKTLRTHPTASIPKVNADPDQVQQVLINLVANARDATETGHEVRITVEDVIVESELPAPLGEPLVPGHYVRLGIADTGSGIPPDTLARIFDPFFTTKAVGKGTGLGLPMVYGTMRRHGGYVVTWSAPGEGTTMELYWPVAASAEAPADPDPAGDYPQPYAAEGAVVLVAEDEPAVRALAVRALEEEGYRVVSGADGVEALEILESAGVRPEVVVTDVTMPRMNGRQLSDAVQTRWPDVRVLFISGHTGEGDVLERLLPAGAPFLRKPFTPEELASAVGMLRAEAPANRIGRRGRARPSVPLDSQVNAGP